MIQLEGIVLNVIGIILQQNIIGKYLVGCFIGCFWFDSSLSQYFSLYWVVSHES